MQGVEDCMVVMIGAARITNSHLPDAAQFGHLIWP